MDEIEFRLEWLRIGNFIKQHVNDIVKFVNKEITQKELDEGFRFIYIEFQLLLERLENAYANPDTENKEIIQQNINDLKELFSQLDDIDHLSEEDFNKKYCQNI